MYPKCHIVETKIINKYKMDEDDNMSTGSDELSGNDLIDNEQDDCVTDQQDCDDKRSDKELLFEPTLLINKNKRFSDYLLFFNC